MNGNITVPNRIGWIGLGRVPTPCFVLVLVFVDFQVGPYLEFWGIMWPCLPLCKSPDVVSDSMGHPSL